MSICLEVIICFVILLRSLSVSVSNEVIPNADRCS